MSIPPGSTAYVRFETVPALTILRGPDAAAGFVSAETKAPGSTGSVAFDTVPPLWFDFPAAAPKAAAVVGVTAPAATTSATAPAAKPAGGHRSKVERARRVPAPAETTLAYTGRDKTSVTAAVVLLSLGWLVRRRLPARDSDG